MNMLTFQFAGASLVALGSGAMWWPEKSLLCVSDLHFGKSERIARLGGALLPPYETQETLARLADDVDRCDPDIVISLGDSFDDSTAVGGLTDATIDRLSGLQAGRNWIWIAGNHDPAPIDLGGTHLSVYQIGGLTFRHEAAKNANGEVSGHYHPKARLSLRGRGVSRPCFLVNEHRLILPAYGTYTGGLRSDHAALTEIMGEGAQAILTGKKVAKIPMPGVCHDHA